MRAGRWQPALPILAVALGATLAGTIATMYIQGRLLAPLLVTARALDEYVRTKKLPALPTGFPDEAGRVMRDAQHCVDHLAGLLLLKNRLLATRSHDARSPLTSITFASQMCRTAFESADVDRAGLRELHDIIDLSAKRQSELITTMMTMARADSGELEVDRGQVAPAALADRVVAPAGVQAEQKNISLTTVCDTAADEEQRLDVAKTEQVLANLVHNAIKFTPRGGRVQLLARASEDWLEFEVQDDGIDIPAEAQPGLFQAFNQDRRSGTDQENGTGLGLWVCKTFVDLQHGELSVRSAPGEGACFTVRLPRLDPGSAQHASSHVIRLDTKRRSSIPSLAVTGCAGDAGALVNEADRVRGDCTRQGLADAGEECVQAAGRALDHLERVAETAVGAVRALDEAARRRPAMQFDTRGFAPFDTSVVPSAGRGAPDPYGYAIPSAGVRSLR